MKVAVLLAALAALVMAAPASLASVYLMSDASGVSEQVEIFGVNFTLPMAPILAAALIGLAVILSVAAIRSGHDQAP